eukprot:11539808-Heterocapsa_arctica.AAC.1
MRPRRVHHESRKDWGARENRLFPLLLKHHLQSSNLASDGLDHPLARSKRRRGALRRDLADRPRCRRFQPPAGSARGRQYPHDHHVLSSDSRPHIGVATFALS